MSWITKMFELLSSGYSAALQQSNSRIETLEGAIRTHRGQKADDRCIFDDDKLYEVLGDGIKCDRRVGDKEEMLKNCARFIERRCESGGWPTYAELEGKVAALTAQCERWKRVVAADVLQIEALKNMRDTLVVDLNKDIADLESQYQVLMGMLRKASAAEDQNLQRALNAEKALTLKEAECEDNERVRSGTIGRLNQEIERQYDRAEKAEVACTARDMEIKRLRYLVEGAPEAS